MLLFLLISLWSQSSLAFTQTVTASGVPVHWKSGFKFNLAGNPVNSVGIGDGDFFSAVTTGLQRWKSASGGAVSFDYWQGSDDSIYLPNSDYNGQSSIYFASHGSTSQSVTPNVLGLTQVWYNTSTGEILEADTVLNDRDFQFTMDPTDTSGFGSDKSSLRGDTRVYIENVITHELGHSLGFSHAGGLQSTMLFMESPEEAHLGCDEQIGIHAMYPDQDEAMRGTIEGKVLTPGGKPVFGAEVVAISRARGTVLSSAMTDYSGHYKVAALEQGAYYLMAEPYYAGPAPLPSYYHAMTSGVCQGGRSFERTFLGDGHRASAVEVTGGTSIDAPTIEVNCDGSSKFLPVSDGESIYSGVIDQKGFGLTDYFSSNLSHRYTLSQLSGNISLRAMSFSLYSPSAFTMTLTDSDGNPVQGEASDRSYVGDSGYVNYDGSLEAQDLPLGDYLLEVVPRSVPLTRYPAGNVSLDREPFLFLSGSVNETPPMLESVLPANARCRMEENFAAYQSPPGNPPRNSTESSNPPSGGCGTIRSITEDQQEHDRNWPGGGFAVMLGWFIPWFFMLAVARIAKALAAATSRG